MKRLIFCLLILSLSIFLQCSKDKQQAPPSLNIDKASFNLSSVASRDSFFITSNVPWSISVPQVASSWLVSDKTSDTAGNTTVHFDIASNNTTNPRTAIVTVSPTNSSATPISISITQDQQDVIITSFTPKARG